MTMDKFTRLTGIIDTYQHNDSEIYHAELIKEIETKVEAKYIEELIEYQQKISKMNILHDEIMEKHKSTKKRYELAYNTVIDRLTTVEKEFEDYRNKKEWKVKIINKQDKINPGYL
jgi:hypothetical protein